MSFLASGQVSNEESIKLGTSFPKILERTTIIVALVYLLLTSLTFWPIFLNPTHLIAGINQQDVYASLWSLWWPSYAIFTAHTTTFYTNLLFYPMGGQLVLPSLLGIISAPLQQISIPFAYNMIIISSFVLTALFTYFLALYLTKNRYASFLAGVVFAFSSVNISHTYIFLNWVALEWIPLFVLFFLLVVRTNKHRYILGSAISLLLASFMGNIEEGIMLALFALAFMYFGAFTNLKTYILNKKLVFSLIELAILALIIGSPLLLPLIHGILYKNEFSYSIAANGLGNNEEWSDSVASFFLPSLYNGIFSSTASLYQNSLFPNQYYWEGISYIGYTVILLSLLAIYFDFKKTGLSNLVIWLSITVLFLWLSLGPIIKIFGQETAIPGIYIIYHFIPILNTIREPGRFDVLVSLSLSLISAFGLFYLLKGLNTDKRKKLILTALFSALVFIECAGFPISQQFISTYYTNASIPSSFSEINGSVNGTVLVLSGSSEGLFSAGWAMYYQTEFEKPIISGYLSRLTLNQRMYQYSIPIVTYASPSNISYPISENYTKANLFSFKKYNIKYVSIIKAYYNASQLALLNAEISTLGPGNMYEDNYSELYYFPQTNTTLNGINGTALVGENWIPSYLFSENFSTWWISDAANITVYLPKSQSVELCTDINSTISGNVSIYSGSVFINKTTVNQNQTSPYQVTLPLNAGVNILNIYISPPLLQNPNLTLSRQIGFSPIRLLYGANSCT